MGSNRRRFLKLIATAAAVSVAGCSGGGDSDGEDGGSSDDSGGGDSDGEDDGSSDDGDTSGADSGGDDEDTETSDGGDADSGDGESGEEGSSGDDSGGDTDGGDTGSNESIQPGDITGTAESSVGGIEVVGHEVTGVEPQVRIELELRNAGNDNSIALTHHNIESKLFNADGNEVLLEQSGTRGPETDPSPGESGVVEIFLFPERGTEPASYEITVNCDGVEYDAFTYCESE